MAEGSGRRVSEALAERERREQRERMARLERALQNPRPRSLADLVVEGASDKPPPAVAKLIEQSNAGLNALGVPWNGPRPRWSDEKLNVSGYTTIKGPQKGQVVIADDKYPVNTLGHEAYHARVLANGGMPMVNGDFGAPVTPGALGNYNRRAIAEEMNKLQAPDTSGALWGLQPNSSAEEQIASLAGYEASLPKGTSIMDTPVGKGVLSDQAQRDYYFTQSSVPHGGVWEGQVPDPGILKQLYRAITGSKRKL